MLTVQSQPSDKWPTKKDRCLYQQGSQSTYRISSPTVMIDAVRVLLRCGSALFKPFLKTPSGIGEIFFALPALSSLPSWSRYAGLKFSLLLDRSLMHNNALGTVSCMLPMEVYLKHQL